MLSNHVILFEFEIFFLVLFVLLFNVHFFLLVIFFGGSYTFYTFGMRIAL